jgi:hypothetical protein
MSRERDERWVYGAMAVLGIAYLAYRYRSSLHIPSIHGLSKVTSSTVAYALAPLIGIFARLVARRRNEATRRRWEASMRSEGHLRDELSVRVRSGERRRGAFLADVHLTRAAFYMLDRSGRREPMRLLLRPGTAHDLHVGDARVVAEPGRSDGTVHVESGGPTKIVVEFESGDAQGWRSDLRRALAKPVGLSNPGGPPEAPSDEPAPGVFGVSSFPDGRKEP